MIRHVWERCAEAAGERNVHVATDDDRIAAACAGFGARVIMTRSDCLTGTDRVAEAAERLEQRFIVNVQGNGNGQTVNGRILYATGIGGGDAGNSAAKFVHLVR